MRPASSRTRTSLAILLLLAPLQEEGEANHWRNTQFTARLEKAPGSLQEAAECFTADCKTQNQVHFTGGVNRVTLKAVGEFVGNAALPESTGGHLRRFVVEKAPGASLATSARYYHCIKCQQANTALVAEF